MKPIVALREHFHRPAFWFAATLALFAGFISLTGFCEITPNTDLTWDIMNAYRLLHEGEIPVHSSVSSFYAMNPPGISFGYIPGLLVFPHHPILAERFGAWLLFAGTLFGLYLWIHPRLGFWSTVLSMLIYAAGWCGGFFLVSFWPRAHPFFYVWFLYMLTLWIERRDGRFAGFAVLIYIAGMYWFMELAPAIFVLPVLYFLFRPPLGLKYVAAAAFLGIALWSPYLIFEINRDFLDLKTFATQKPIYPQKDMSDVLYDKSNHFVFAWDVPRLKAQVRGETIPAEAVEDKPTGFWLQTDDWGLVWAEYAERNYLGEWGYIFRSNKLDCWGFHSFESGRLLLEGNKDWEAGVYSINYPTSRNGVYKTKPHFWKTLEQYKRFAPFFNFGGTQSFGIWIWQMLLFATAVTIAALRFRKDAGVTKATDRGAVIWSVLVIGAILPAVVMAVMVPTGMMFESERRFWWLWVAEAALLGSVMGALKFRGWRVLVPLGAVAVITLSQNSQMQYLIQNAFGRWPEGRRGQDELALEKLAEIMKSEGLTSAYIGYDINQLDWLPATRRADGVGKCSIQFDVTLFLAHGITNLDTNVEGLSPKDEFRIFSPQYNVDRSDSLQLRWSMTTDGSLPEMVKVADAGEYQILRKAK